MQRIKAFYDNSQIVVTDFVGSPTRMAAQLTPEQLRVIKRAPKGSLDLAVQYASRRLPNCNILLNFRDVPREDNLLAALMRPTAKNVLIAFMFMYHDHVMRHSIYFKVP